MVHNSARFTTLITCALLAALPAVAHADTTTIYVAPEGVDTATGVAAAPLRTLGAALSRAKGGETIEMAAGAYPAAQDIKARSIDVAIRGQGPTATQVQGLRIQGGQHLRFDDVGFTSTVAIEGHPIKHAAQPAQQVTIRNSDITAAGVCMRIREGAKDISLADSHLHDCAIGISGPGNPYRSSGITIDRNVIEHLSSDGIQFGAWDSVRITRNLIRDINDPLKYIHNDGIQFTGNSTDVEVSANEIRDSRTQLMLIQDAIGPIDHVTVVNNLLDKAGAVALQSIGATHASFVNNTIWRGALGGMWLRKGYYRNGTYVVPRDTVLSNNVVSSLRIIEGAATSASAGNVVPCSTALTLPVGTRCVSDPSFTNLVAGDYSLTPDSPIRQLGSSLALPETDLNGAERTGAVPGAYN